MEEVFESYQLSLDILDQIKKQIPTDNHKKNIFNFYAQNVDNYVKKIQNDFLGELKRNIAYQKRYNSGVSVRTNPNVYHLYNTCSQYGFNEKEVFDYVRKEDVDGLNAYIFEHTCYMEICDYLRFFETFHSLVLWKYATPDFPKEGNEYARLKYASTIAGIKNLADIALDLCLKCFDEKVLSRTVVAMERYQKYVFDTTVQVPQKALPYYQGKATLIGTIIGATIGGISGGVGGYLLMLSVEMSNAILGTGIFGGIIGAGIGFLCGKGTAAKKEMQMKRIQVQAENEKTKNEEYKKFEKQFSCSNATVFAKNKDALLYVFQALGDCCRKILNMPEFSFLPKDYLYHASALKEFVNYYDNKRVSTMQEAVNLYISTMDAQRREEEMRRLQTELIEEQQRQAELQQRECEKRTALLQEIEKVVKSVHEEQQKAAKQREESLQNLQNELQIAKTQIEQAYREAENERQRIEFQEEKILKGLGL